MSGMACSIVELEKTVKTSISGEVFVRQENNNLALHPDDRFNCQDG